MAQRDVGDGGVQHLHERGDRHHDGDQPRIAVAGGGTVRRAGLATGQRTRTDGVTDMPGASW